MTSTEKDLYSIYDDLKSRIKGIDDYQALRIAAEVQRNQILADAFLVRVPGKAEDAPVALEAIAMALGKEPHRR